MMNYSTTAKSIAKNIIVRILTWQAKSVLRKYKPKIIVVTGSVGKTSTKDAIFTVLSKFKSVRKSEKSFNSEIGLPLTILGVPNGWNNFFLWTENIAHGFALILKKRAYPEWLVLEVGAGKPGDITSVAKWLAPDMVVVTRFPDKPVHVEFFGTPEKIIEEKSAIVFALKEEGTLILNQDDEKVYALHEKAHRRTVSYGLSDTATYHASYVDYLTGDSESNKKTIPYGLTFKLSYGGNTFPVIVPRIIGEHFAGSILAAIACAHEAGCDLLASISSVSQFELPPGRSSLLEGINNSILIDDTYNASPVAVESALDTLAKMGAKRSIAVLGDMLELGKFTEEAHKAVGIKASVIVDILVLVGPRSKFIGNGALESGFTNKNIYHFDAVGQSLDFLKGMVKKGDVILLKGSQGVRLEKAVEAIMAHPELKEKLLCRQEEEWRER